MDAAISLWPVGPDGYSECAVSRLVGVGRLGCGRVDVFESVVFVRLGVAR
jgi:hypothetical protein